MLARALRTFYLHNRDVNGVLDSNDSVSLTNYRRIILLASVDFLITLPVNIAGIVLAIVSWKSVSSLPFYWGWTLLHSNWGPKGYSYAELEAEGAVMVAYFYFYNWTYPVLAFAIFGIFGLTLEARASYWRVVCMACARFGWNPARRVSNLSASLGDIEFGLCSQSVSSHDKLGRIEWG